MAGPRAIARAGGDEAVETRRFDGLRHIVCHTRKTRQLNVGADAPHHGGGPERAHIGLRMFNAGAALRSVQIRALSQAVVTIEVLGSDKNLNVEPQIG